MGQIWGARPKMTLRDRLTMSAFEKYRRYGRIPWKFICHILLLCFSTAQILLWNVEDGSYYRASNRNWQYWFMYRPSTTSVCDLYSYDQVIDSVNETLMNFYNIDKLSVDSYRSHFRRRRHKDSKTQQREQVPPQDVFETIDDPSITNSTSNMSPQLLYTYYLHPESLFDYKVQAPKMDLGSELYRVNDTFAGPFDVKTLGEDKVISNINRLHSAVLNLRLDSFIFGTVFRSCLEWEVKVEWDFKDRGQVKQSVSSRVVGSCNVISWNEALTYELIWLNIPVLIIAAIYFLLTIKAVIRSIQTFLTIRQRQRLLESQSYDNTSPGRSARLLRSHRWHGDPVTWSDLSCQDKCNFFSVWFVLSISSCICLIVLSLSNMINIQSHSPTDNGPKLLAGLGCALIWFSLLSYFEHNKGYYILIVTLKKGVPRVARFMVGVMPMMLGYAFFGMVCFGSYSDRFDSFSASMITLFAILNGDVIRETFLNLDSGGSPVVSQVYMYSFICLFIYVVLNVFIAIIEEAFFSAWNAVEVSSESYSLNNPFHKVSDRVEKDDTTQVRKTFSQAQKHTMDIPGNIAARDESQAGAPSSMPVSIQKQDGQAYRSNSTDSDLRSGNIDVARSWTRFRELLFNINEDELLRRHEELHHSDSLIHNELNRRNIVAVEPGIENNT